MYYFCTYFDHRYLTKGLALYHSLKQHSQPFRLWVLCLNQPAYEILSQLALPELRLITLTEFEDAALREAKSNRSLAEYYFTCTPSLPLFILKQAPEVDLITYLDADLFFFSNLAPIYQEIGNHSIAIIGHRFSPNYTHLHIYGIYNVGWLSFRHNLQGLACLQWWRERCLEWCYDRPENGRFADQKYLDDWPTRFQDVIVLQHKGVNVARWNLDNYVIQTRNNQIWVDEQPLIFFHFHGVAEVEPGSYTANLDSEQFTETVRETFIHYFQILSQIKQQLAPQFPQIATGESVRGQQTPQIEGIQEAIQIIERALRRPPNPTTVTELFISLSVVQATTVQLVKAQQIPEAIRTLEEQIRQQPSLATAYNDLGVLLFQTDETRTEGVNHIQRAAQLSPTNLNIQKNLAQIYMVYNRHEEALALFKRILSHSPQEVDSLVRIGEIYTRLGRLEEAKRSWEQVLQLAPHHEQARRALGK